jgi:hypothetical protein
MAKKYGTDTDEICSNNFSFLFFFLIQTVVLFIALKTMEEKLKWQKNQNGVPKEKLSICERILTYDLLQKNKI